MNALLQFLSGKKTYLTAGVIGVLLFGEWQTWWTIPTDVYGILMAAAIAFLRAGVGKGPDDTGGPTPAPAADPPAPPPKPASGPGPLMLAMASLALLVCSCSTSSQKVAYQSAGTAIVSVDAAMNLWGAYVAANHPSTNVELEVKAAYEKYQAAMALTCDAGAAYAAACVTNSAGASSLQSSSALLAVQNAAQNANQDLADLENLLTQLGVKLQ